MVNTQEELKALLKQIYDFLQTYQRKYERILYTNGLDEILKVSPMATIFGYDTRQVGEQDFIERSSLSLQYPIYYSSGIICVVWRDHRSEDHEISFPRELLTADEEKVNAYLFDHIKKRIEDIQQQTQIAVNRLDLLLQKTKQLSNIDMNKLKQTK